MVGLSSNLVLAKTHADSLHHVKNLNLWGQDISDVGALTALITALCRPVPLSFCAEAGEAIARHAKRRGLVAFSESN